MPYQKGDLIIGEVTNVKPYALFFVFEDGSQGLCHISEISDNYIRDIERYGSKGDKIKVLVLSIDEENNFLRVSYKKVPPEEAYSTHKNMGRHQTIIDETGFAPLKEKLDEWIDITLKKKKEN